ncbi:hypothetical protein [Streptomyces sp. NRRL S-448]|uniref:hypothetical protein n=1 Tax=Streptomyces sp. NRRL S-448 TaxID=1463907 RepID=UPI00356812CB
MITSLQQSMRRAPKSCQDATMIIFPIIVTAGFFIACLVADTALAPECTPFTMLHLAIPAIGKGSGMCKSLPFWGDLASITLTMTASLIIAAHWVFVSRLQNLDKKLTDSGLMANESDFGEAIERYRKEWKAHWSLRVLLLLLCLSAAAFFYVHTHERSQVFASLSAQTSHLISAERFEATWWMNFENHPVITSLWLLLGATGGYFAVKQGLLYVYLIRVTRKANDKWGFEYVSALRDESFGWKPVGEIINIVYVGFVDFAFASAVLFYVMGSDQGARWPEYAILSLGALGLLFNLIALGILITFMMKKHHEIIEREKKRVLKKVSDPAESERAAYWMACGTHLHLAPQHYPMNSRLKPLIALTPGIFALYRIAAEIHK